MFCYTNSRVESIKGTIVFLGDSITFDGTYITFLNTYLSACAPNSDINIINLGVSSETVSGLSEPDHPFMRPCLSGRIDSALSMTKPDWIVLSYGINDGIYYPLSDERFDAFKQGYINIIDRIKQFNPDIKIAVMTPPPFIASDFAKGGNELLDKNADKFSFFAVYENYNDVMSEYAQWVKTDLSSHVDVVLDVNSALNRYNQNQIERNPSFCGSDGIHPDKHGHFVIANVILEELFGVYLTTLEECLEADNSALFNLVRQRDILLYRYYTETIGHDNPNKYAYLTGKVLDTENKRLTALINEYVSSHPNMFTIKKEWEGFETHTAIINGYEVIISCPKEAAKGRPWVWRTEFFGAFPSADIAMLNQGWHVAHVMIPHRFGAPCSMDDMRAFHCEITKKYDLSPKPVLFGFSRGGLYALHYAARFADQINALYLDAPVVDVRSWPAGIGNGCGSPWDWERCQKAFGLTDETVDDFADIMNSAITSVIKAAIPLIIVAGDSDEVVPLEENGKLLFDAYSKTDLPFEYIVKPGIGHHPHSLDNPHPIVDFINKYAK